MTRVRNLPFDSESKGISVLEFIYAHHEYTSPLHAAPPKKKTRRACLHTNTLHGCKYDIYNEPQSVNRWRSVTGGEILGGGGEYRGRGKVGKSLKGEIRKRRGEANFTSLSVVCLVNVSPR